MNNKTSFSISFVIITISSSLIGFIIGALFSSFTNKSWIINNTIFVFTFAGLISGLIIAFKTKILKFNQSFEEETRRMNFETEKDNFE